MGKIQLGVLYGSRSCEHEVSIISAVQLMRNVNREKYDLIPLYITTQGEWFTGDALLDMETYRPFRGDQKGLRRVSLDLTANSGVLTTVEHSGKLFGGDRVTVVAKLDVVIPVFHGLHGEDGSIQGLMELCNLPYASSGVGACAIGMDKVYMKNYFRSQSFPVLPDCWFLRSAWREDEEAILSAIEEKLAYPVFTKPACLGSSIGVSRADDREELRKALELAFEFDRKVLVEKGINKPVELNCSVLGGNGKAQASEIEMPISEGELLDFGTKYLASGGSKGMASLKRILPAPIDEELRSRLQELSRQVFLSMDCKGVCRIDYMVEKETGEVYITEINTIPGSMSYYLWEKSGLSYPELIDQLVEIAREAQEEKDSNHFAFTSDILSGVSFGGKSGKLGKLGKL